MNLIEIDLPEAEFVRLNSLFPPTVKSSNVGERAVELVKLHFRSRHAGCAFTKNRDGYDLQVKWDGGEEKIEIKGTADEKIAFGKLKVSGRRSYDLLLKGTPIYRVVSVYSRSLSMYVIRHGEDFEMNEEPRWTIKRT